MGLFRRKKDEAETPVESQTIEPMQVKSPEEIQKERIASELEHLNSELESKTEHLKSVTEKLDKVKSEYDELVGTLMASKKEANEKKAEMDAQRAQHQQILKQIESARAGVTIHDLARDTGVTTRTIRRDLTALQEAGFALFDALARLQQCAGPARARQQSTEP